MGQWIVVFAGGAVGGLDQMLDRTNEQAELNENGAPVRAADVAPRLLLEPETGIPLY